MSCTPAMTLRSCLHFYNCFSYFHVLICCFLICVLFVLFCSFSDFILNALGCLGGPDLQFAWWYVVRESCAPNVRLSWRQKRVNVPLAIKRLQISRYRLPCCSEHGDRAPCCLCCAMRCWVGSLSRCEHPQHLGDVLLLAPG